MADGKHAESSNTSSTPASSDHGIDLVAGGTESGLDRAVNSPVLDWSLQTVLEGLVASSSVDVKAHTWSLDLRALNIHRAVLGSLSWVLNYLCWDEGVRHTAWRFLEIKLN